MSRLTLPGEMPVAIAGAAQTAGKDNVETGGFILGDASGTHGTALAFTGDKGIERRRGLFQVSGLAMASLFEWVSEREMTVLAQWHSHRRRAFLSQTDLEHGFDVPGFHTTVVPFYESPSPDPGDWGWWTYDGETWVEAEAPLVVGSGFRAVTFEEGEVREH